MDKEKVLKAVKMGMGDGDEILNIWTNSSKDWKFLMRNNGIQKTMETWPDGCSSEPRSIHQKVSGLISVKGTYLVVGLIPG